MRIRWPAWTSRDEHLSPTDSCFLDDWQIYLEGGNEDFHCLTYLVLISVSELLQPSNKQISASTLCRFDKIMMLLSIPFRQARVGSTSVSRNTIRDPHSTTGLESPTIRKSLFEFTPTLSDVHTSTCTSINLALLLREVPRGVLNSLLLVHAPSS